MGAQTSLPHTHTRRASTPSSPYPQSPPTHNPPPPTHTHTPGSSARHLRSPPARASPRASTARCHRWSSGVVTTWRRQQGSVWSGHSLSRLLQRDARGEVLQFRSRGSHAHARRARGHAPRKPPIRTQRNSPTRSCARTRTALASHRHDSARNHAPRKPPTARTTMRGPNPPPTDTTAHSPRARLLHASQRNAIPRRNQGKVQPPGALYLSLNKLIEPI